MSKFNPTAERVIKAAGGASKLARALNISPQAVGKWLRSGVPVERVLELEHLTRISRHDIRPDIYPRDRPSRGEQHAQA